MRKFVLAATAAMAVVSTAPAYAQKAGDKIAGSYICVFKDNLVSKGNAAAEANRAAQSVGGRPTHVYKTVLRGFAAHIPDQAVEKMKAANPSIAYCEQDQIVSAPPIQFHGKPTGGGGIQPAQDTPWGVARIGGGGIGTFATAWVIDTGIDLTHPDLNVDVQRSRNFVDRETSPQDLTGHGTHVAGTIAAYDNTIGVIGVAPGARVVAVRVLNRRGSGTNSGVIAGVEYAAEAKGPGDVANMSLGGGISTALDTAVINAGKTGLRIAMAAGNESDLAMNHSPGRASGDGLFTVSAVTVGDNWASFSNRGNPPIDYAEPGVQIPSTWTNGGYNTISGTSMATPHLAGLLLRTTLNVVAYAKGDPDGNLDPIAAVK